MTALRHSKSMMLRRVKNRRNRIVNIFSAYCIHLSLSKVEPYTKANGSVAFAMVTASSNGWTGAFTSASGVMEKLVVRASCTMQMATSMMASGLMTKRMVMELTRMQTVLDTLASGRMTDRKARGTKPGLMALSTMASTVKERNTEKAG